MSLSNHSGLAPMAPIAASLEPSDAKRCACRHVAQCDTVARDPAQGQRRGGPAADVDRRERLHVPCRIIRRPRQDEARGGGLTEGTLNLHLPSQADHCASNRTESDPSTAELLYL